MHTIGGYRVTVAPSGFNQRVRKPTKKRWMQGTCYFKRIDKKWLKRHGFTWVETMKPGQVIIAESLGMILCRREDASVIQAELDVGSTGIFGREKT